MTACRYPLKDQNKLCTHPFKIVYLKIGMWYWSVFGEMCWFIPKECAKLGFKQT